MTQQKNQKQSSTLKEVLHYIKPHSLFVILSLCLAFITVILTLYVPILTGEGIDYIIEAGNVNFQNLIPLLIKIGVIVLITAFAQWLMNLCNNRITYHVVKDIRAKAFARLEELPLKYIDSHQHGEIISRIVSDVDQFSDGLLLGFTQFFTSALTILGTLLFMLSVNIQITMVVVLITPISLFVASFIAKKSFHMFKKQSETRGEMTSLVNEMIGNQKIVCSRGR